MNTLPLSLLIRPFSPADDTAALTDLLHRAYAPLAARGLHFTASHQTETVTRERLSRGHALVAVLEDGRSAGTLTVYPADPAACTRWYRDPRTFHFGQFAVDPQFKGCGIGRALHETALAHAAAEGGHFMALDTAAPATELMPCMSAGGMK